MGRTNRKKRASSSRRRGSRRKRWVLWAYALVYFGLAVAALIAAKQGYRTVMTHPKLKITQITISGVSQRTLVELAPLAQGYKGHNIFSVNLDALRDKMLEHPWIETANVNSQLPHTIKIVATERKPAGIVRQGSNLMLVTNEGHQISSLESFGGVFDAPILKGIPKGEPSLPTIVLGLETLAQLRQVSLLFWDNIETLDLSDNDNMVVRLRNEKAPIFLGDQVIGANIKSYLSIAQHIQNNYPALDYIELGFPNQIAIMPKKTEQK